jgi:hypothetical protein
MSAECKFWKKSENECLYSRHELLEKTVEMNLTCLALNIFKFQLLNFLEDFILSNNKQLSVSFLIVI